MGSNQNSPQFHHPSRNTKTSPKICHNFSRKTVGTSTHYATIYMSHRCKRVRGNGMFDYEKIHIELETYLGGWYQYYDVPEIMAALREYKTEDGGCIASIDDVDPDDFAMLLQEYER